MQPNFGKVKKTTLAVLGEILYIKITSIQQMEDP